MLAHRIRKLEQSRRERPCSACCPGRVTMVFRTSSEADPPVAPCKLCGQVPITGRVVVPEPLDDLGAFGDLVLPHYVLSPAFRAAMRLRVGRLSDAGQKDGASQSRPLPRSSRKGLP